jgi:hypothetical protein
MGNLSCRKVTNIALDTANAVLKELNDDKVVELGRHLEQGREQDVSKELLVLSRDYDHYDNASKKRIDYLISSHVVRLERPAPKPRDEHCEDSS